MRAEGSGKEDKQENEKANATGRWNVPPIPPRPGTSESKRRGGEDTTSDTADCEWESRDAPGYVLTPEDLPLREVYVEWVHGNPGTHLDVGITDDGTW